MPVLFHCVIFLPKSLKKNSPLHCAERQMCLTKDSHGTFTWNFNHWQSVISIYLFTQEWITFFLLKMLHQKRSSLILSTFFLLSCFCLDCFFIHGHSAVKSKSNNLQNWPPYKDRRCAGNSYSMMSTAVRSTSVNWAQQRQTPQWMWSTAQWRHVPLLAFGCIQISLDYTLTMQSTMDNSLLQPTTGGTIKVS